MMKLQEMLIAGTPLVDFADRYAIKATRHPRFPNLVQFKYSQIESPMGEAVVQESRGVILDADDDWNVVARPFDKFFNYGEGHAKPIDWATARFQEKLDGSLLILYFYAGAWHVATGGMPDAGGPVNGLNITFRELFWQTWLKMGLRLPDTVNASAREFCYMFELMSPLNRVVVEYDEAKLALIGVRHRDGTEISPENYGTGSAWNYPIVPTYPFNDLRAVLATLPSMDGFKQEGYVVVDENFHRVKLKCDQYLMVHHAKDGFGIRRLIALVQSNESTEWLSRFPEWLDALHEARARYEALITELQAAYETIKGITDQKAFAFEAVRTRYPGALFALRKGQVASIREALAKVHVDYMIDLLDAKSVALQVANL